MENINIKKYLEKRKEFYKDNKDRILEERSEYYKTKISEQRQKKKLVNVE